MNQRTTRTGATKRGAVLALALALLAPSAASAQHFPSDSALTARLRSLVESGRAKGIVLGVVEADGTRRVVSYGNAGPDARPLGARSTFEIGSIGKTFTATLLADMVARGEVSLSDPVSKYLPAGVVVPSRGGRAITLLDLATHRSGLPRMRTDFDPADDGNPYADDTVEKMYAFLSSHELRRDPGAEWEYSNLGFGLLGHALARAAGGRYEEVVRERLLEPLGMRMTGDRRLGEGSGWLTRGHDVKGNVVPHWDRTEANVGATGLSSNVEDMLAFLAANLGPARTPLERAMREAHARRAGADEGDIGLAWLTRSRGDRELVWHGGDTGGYQTAVAFDPERRVGAVLLSNSDGKDPQLFSLLFDLIVPPPPEFRVAEAVLLAYAGEYEVAPGRVVVMTVEEGALYAQPPGQPRARLFAESESRFALGSARSPVKISFTRGDSGAVTGLVVHQNGGERPARRLP